jgi:beta-glucosidase-like glycosyl hydrolase
MTAAARGPVMLGVEGLELTPTDRERLAHPLVGGVILFARNFAEADQLVSLTTEIHAAREPRLPIAVDHEGGRVQRLRRLHRDSADAHARRVVEQEPRGRAKAEALGDDREGASRARRRLQPRRCSTSTGAARR